MNRGEVHLVTIPLPDRTAGSGTEFRHKAKYCVVLREEGDVVFVVASTLSEPTRARRPFEVFVGPSEGFDHDTVIDGRWVYTLSRAWFDDSAASFSLPAQVMGQVSLAIAVGLGMVAAQ